VAAAQEKKYLYDIQCFEHHTVCYMFILFGTNRLIDNALLISEKT